MLARSIKNKNPRRRSSGRPKSIEEHIYQIVSKSDRHNVIGFLFDLVLYSLILLCLGLSWLNTLTFFNEQDQFKHIHNLVMVSATVVFSLEYLLRLWSCTAVRAYRAPVVGRIKFMFSPLMLVDLLALASVIFLGINANLLFLRVIRLFRLSEYLGEEGIYSPFQILKRSIANKAEELIITVFAAGTIIILCSYIVFYIEKSAQPEAIESLTPSVAWSVGVLTGTSFADFAPITSAGRALHFIMMIMGVVIVGLPVGIITGSFVQEIREAKAVDSSKKRADIIRQTFQQEDKIKTRALLGQLGLPEYRKWLDIDVAMARLQFSSEEIFNAVALDSGLRVRACKQSLDSSYESNLIIEHFPANTSFGVHVNQGSTIHVVSTQSCSDAFIGHFSRVLAEFINANYYSNEYFSSGELLPEKRVNFAKNPCYEDNNQETPTEVFAEWREVLQEYVLPGDYVLNLGTSNAAHDAVLHVLCGGNKGDEIGGVQSPTTDSLEHVQQFYDHLASLLQPLELEINSHQTYGNTDSLHISQFMHKTIGANVITVFVSARLLQFESPEKYYRSIKAIADAWHSTFKPRAVSAGNALTG